MYESVVHYFIESTRRSLCYVSEQYWADGSIRIEIRLYVDRAKRHKLKNVAAWAEVGVDTLSFELLGGFNVGNAIQPLLAAHEQKKVSKTNLVTYTL